MVAEPSRKVSSNGYSVVGCFRSTLCAALYSSLLVVLSLIAIQDGLKQQVREAALELFGVELGPLNAEAPPRPDLGDLAFPVSFELAKLIKQVSGVKLAPRAIAEKLKDKLESSSHVARIDVAGAGYLNVFFNRSKLLSLFAEASSQDKFEPILP